MSRNPLTPCFENSRFHAFLRERTLVPKSASKANNVRGSASRDARHGPSYQPRTPLRLPLEVNTRMTIESRKGLKQKATGNPVAAVHINMNNSTRSLIQQKIIQAGVKNLKEYGYPGCDSKNILTDQIYKAFFSSMLEDNLGKGYDSDIQALMKECGE